MTNLFKKADDQILIGAYIDPNVIEELDIRALLIKNSRSEVLRYAITILQDFQPIQSVLTALIDELMEEWQLRVMKKRADHQVGDKLEKGFFVFLEEVRAELKRKKIVQQYIDLIITGMKKRFVPVKEVRE